MKPFLIIKTGGTFGEITATKGDFEQWTAQAMGLAPRQWECVNVQAGETLPDPDGYAGCVVTGSHDMVTDQTPWIQHTGDWINRGVAAGLPMLGICFGHQLMAMSLGGDAGYHPGGMEIGTVPITLTAAAADDPIFSQLPPVFPGHVSHSQTAFKLPGDGVLLASGEHDPHQAFRCGERAWGVQFHPEFDAEAVRFYVKMFKEKLTGQGHDVAAILDAVRETPQSTALMRHFAAYCRDR